MCGVVNGRVSVDVYMINGGRFDKSCEGEATSRVAPTPPRISWEMLHEEGSYPAIVALLHLVGI